MTVWVDGRRVFVDAGRAVILFPWHRERFAFSAEGVARHGWCEVVKVAFEPGVEKRLRALETRVYRTPEPIRSLSAQALSLRSDARWEFDHLRESIVLEFFRATDIPDPTLQSKPGARLPPSVTQALDVIHRDFAALNRVSELAERVGGIRAASRTALSRTSADESVRVPLESKNRAGGGARFQERASTVGSGNTYRLPDTVSHVAPNPPDVWTCPERAPCSTPRERLGVIPARGRPGIRRGYEIARDGYAVWSVSDVQ
jgi:hypothetical protein